MSDDFGSKLLQLLLVRAMEGESQIKETLEWNRETKGIVPLVQALGVMAGLAAMSLGLGMLGWGATRAVDVHIDLGGTLLIGVLLLLGLSGIYGLARHFFQTSPVIVAAGLGVILFLVLLAALLLAIFGGRLDLWAVLALVASPPVLVAGIALGYRQLIDLLDPYGKTSPVERQMFPYLGELFVGSQEQAKRLDVPYRINGEMREPASELMDGEPIVRIHRDDLALIEFISEAAQRGLSRRKWLQRGQQNVILPRSGVEVGRDTYDEMMTRMIDWGFVTPGGEGRSSHWMTRPADAVQVIEREIVAQLIEGQRV